MRRRPEPPALAAAFSLVALGACLAGGGVLGDAPPEPTPAPVDVADAARFDVELADGFSLVGVLPSHGPFVGGTRVTLAGSGFGSDLEVEVGGAVVAAGSLLASTPTRAAAVTPPGRAGAADVTVRSPRTGETRVLRGGFVYDALVVEPASGATSGGTRVVVRGDGTRFGSSTAVTVGGAPCTDVVVASPTELACTTPPGAPGAKDVAVSGAGEPVQVREAYTYSDSPDGYRGGLAGGALSGRVRVLAFDAFTGAPLEGATAIAGEELASAVVGRAGATGVAELVHPSLQGKATVTVAARCHQPETYVDVPVDTVTVYLAPTLDPACAEGDPPSVGGGRGGRYGAVVSGELVFPGGVELRKSTWTTVPRPSRPTERQAAYVFQASPSPGGQFYLPSEAEAVTPASPGGAGYGYEVVVFPGYTTLYAIAGLEDRSTTPPTFHAYAMGVARGVNAPAQGRVLYVDVAMDVLLDHTLPLEVLAPAPGPRGPDRVVASASLTLGAAGYAFVPRAFAERPLPLGGRLDFTGLPPLAGALAGEAYVAAASAATGDSLQAPASVVGRVRITDTSAPTVIGGFLGVPEPVSPGPAPFSGRGVEIAGASGPVDLFVVSLASAGGLVTWTVTAPASRRSFGLPDLAALPGPDRLGLVRGALEATVVAGRLEGFDYARLRAGQRATGAFAAYALDRVVTVY